MTEQQVADATRWQGYTHTELYRLLHEGTGPTASAVPSQRWAELSATLLEVGDDLGAALERSSSGWQGRAANTAYERLSELVGWARQTGGNAGDMRELVETQAGHLARARAEMPVPGDDAATATPDPAAAVDPAAQVIAAQQDAEPVEAASSAGQQKAFEVMTAYQRDTSTNTGAMATFNPPVAISGLGSDEPRHRGPGVQLTTPALSVGVGAGPAPAEPRHDHGHHGHGQHGRGDGRFDWAGTSSSGAHDVARRPMQQPGAYTTAAPLNEPLYGGSGVIGSYGGTNSGTGRTGTGTGTGTGVGTGSGAGAGSPRPGAVPHAGSSIGAGGSIGAMGTAGIGGVPGLNSPDLQSAAASQMAAAAGTPAAAAPGAAAGTGSAGGQDKTMMRRLGAEAIGSGQWFGDAQQESEVRGAGPSRRRHNYTDERVTESVQIDGQEHQLPPGVIGES